MNVWVGGQTVGGTRLPLCEGYELTLEADDGGVGGSALDLYKSNSYFDDLAWAAAWLYRASRKPPHPATHALRGVEVAPTRLTWVGCGNSRPCNPSTSVSHNWGVCCVQSQLRHVSRSAGHVCCSGISFCCFATPRSYQYH